jgi:hypothetical protein
VVQFGNRVENLAMQVHDVVGNEVGQIAIFRVVPTLLDGIQFGRIGRQPFECEPIGMIGVEVGRCRPMYRPAIPHHDRPAAAMFMELLQKPDGFIGIDVFRCDMKVQR